VGGPTRRTGTAHVEVADNGDGTRRLSLVSFELAEPEQDGQEAPVEAPATNENLESISEEEPVLTDETAEAWPGETLAQ
jgi:hypothetical protein